MKEKKNPKKTKGKKKTKIDLEKYVQHVQIYIYI